jgi:hypothetical protein
VSAPDKPAREQAKAEKRLRDLGATVTFTPATGYPHTHAEPDPRCIRCVLIESARRVNGPDGPDVTP